ncbi:MAG: ribosome biogenesis/translation initiation ATPase RLI [Candidatus Korarchaeota archaeon]
MSKGVRIAVIDRDKCKPRDCLACMKHCPLNLTGTEVIIVEAETGFPLINENLCSGCGICVRVCPRKAIKIINLPHEIEGALVHRYGQNGFKLYRFPALQEKGTVGILGQNGIGKSTILKILAGKITPNLGMEHATWDDVMHLFRGSTIHGIFRRLKEKNLNVVLKPQNVSDLPKVVTGSVRDILYRLNQDKDNINILAEKLDLVAFLDTDISSLSGGELQRVAIAVALSRKADLYLFDEPSSYLDIKQRMKVAQVIRELGERASVVVVEHDLVMLDIMADYIHLVYGEPGAYGVVSQPMGIREGINTYIRGYIKSENVRFRPEHIKFDYGVQTSDTKVTMLSYPAMKKKLGEFSLSVEPGDIKLNEIVGVIGPNGIGKTTFIKMLAGIIKPDNVDLQYKIRVSHKPQYLNQDIDATAGMLLMRKPLFNSPVFRSFIYEALELEPLLEKQINELSGGELQRVAIAEALSEEADLYLLDEPSAYLDVEQRYSLVRALRAYVGSMQCAAVVVEHDIMVLDAISSRVMLFTGVPGKEGHSSSPVERKDGINEFLKTVGVTFRKDPDIGRPRVNKPGSRLDKEQKAQGIYYY